MVRPVRQQIEVRGGAPYDWHYGQIVASSTKTPRRWVQSAEPRKMNRSFVGAVAQRASLQITDLIDSLFFRTHLDQVLERDGIED